MQICDICNCSLGEDSKRFTAIQIQKVVKSGFRPPKGSFDEMSESLGAGEDYMDTQWVNQVMSDSSDWLLCPKCASRVDKFLESRRPFKEGKVKKSRKSNRRKTQTANAKYLLAKTEKKLSIFKKVLYIASGLGAVLTFSSFHKMTTETNTQDESILIVFTVIDFLCTILWFLSAWSIGKRKFWGRKLSIVTGFFSLINIPIGTILGLYILIILFSNDVKKIFVVKVVKMKKLSEKKVKEMLLKQIGMVSPALKEVVTVTVILDEPWNRYNCKFDVGELTTHWQFLPILEKQNDFTARLKGFVENIILSFKMKGLNI